MSEGQVIVCGPPGMPLRSDERQCTDPLAKRARVVFHRLARMTPEYPFWHEGEA